MRTLEPHYDGSLRGKPEARITIYLEFYGI
jgi:hypothetical protein